MNIVQLRKRLSENIKKQRKQQAITQDQLAEAAGVSVSTVVAIENCRAWISDKTILSLSRVLHVDVYELFLPTDSTKSRNDIIKIADKILTMQKEKLQKDINFALDDAISKIKDASE